MVTAHPELSELCGALIDLANERGGPDNITVVAAHFDGDGLPEPSASEDVGYAIYHLEDGDDEEPTTVPLPTAVAAAPSPPLATGRTRTVLLMAAVLCLLAALLLVWL
jgi:protein phosphatase